eukprot:4202752-Amphidinium_carterae.1
MFANAATVWRQRCWALSRNVRRLGCLVTSGTWPTALRIVSFLFIKVLFQPKFYICNSNNFKTVTAT